jgi:hypothetical protein
MARSFANAQKCLQKPKGVHPHHEDVTYATRSDGSSPSLAIVIVIVVVLVIDPMFLLLAHQFAYESPKGVPRSARMTHAARFGRSLALPSTSVVLTLEQSLSLSSSFSLSIQRSFC